MKPTILALVAAAMVLASFTPVHAQFPVMNETFIQGHGNQVMNYGSGFGDFNRTAIMGSFNRVGNFNLPATPFPGQWPGASPMGYGYGVPHSPSYSNFNYVQGHFNSIINR